MDETDQNAIELWCDSLARLLDLPLGKADRNEIIVNLRMLKQQMDLVNAFAGDDREEPAPLFRA
jgi:hypothetical protein